MKQVKNIPARMACCKNNCIRFKLILTGCFNANKYEAEIQADFDLGGQMGVSGTPTVFVNGQRVGQPRQVPSYQEIADKLRLPEGTVKSRINRGRTELARQIRKLRGDVFTGAQS